MVVFDGLQGLAFTDRLFVLQTKLGVCFYLLANTGQTVSPIGGQVLCYTDIGQEIGFEVDYVFR